MNKSPHRDEALRLFDLGVPQKEIARRLGIPYQSIQGFRKRRDNPFIRPPSQEQIHTAAVKKLAEQHFPDWEYSQYAKTVGISKTAVGRILKSLGYNKGRSVEHLLNWRRQNPVLAQEVRTAGLNKSLKFKKAYEKNFNDRESIRKAIRTKSTIPACMKCPEHGCAREWSIISPKGVTYTFKNLSHFVRTNKTMFNSDDVVWKKCKVSGVEQCRASQGLAALDPYTRKGTPRCKCYNSWKGWRWNHAYSV